MARKKFIRGTIFHEKCSNISPKILSLSFVGPKKSRQISLPKTKKITDELLQERKENNA